MPVTVLQPDGPQATENAVSRFPFAGGGVGAQGAGRLSENGGSSFSESPLRLAALATSPIDGGG